MRHTSITARLAECCRKRRYPPSFIARTVGADGADGETQEWTDHAVACAEFYERDIAPTLAL